MKSIRAAESAIIEATPAIVAKHRDAGILTWKLIHQIEDEVIHEVGQSGKHSPTLLRMLKASPFLGYPKNDSPADFAGSEAVPITFTVIQNAWNRVN